MPTSEGGCESTWVEYLVCVKCQFMAAFVTVAFIMTVKVKSLEKEVSYPCNLYNCVSSLQQKGVGMNEPLVDCEGYPRSDVDLYQVRTARHNIVCE